jgi:hypothetical protein
LTLIDDVRAEALAVVFVEAQRILPGMRFTGNWDRIFIRCDPGHTREDVGIGAKFVVAPQGKAGVCALREVVIVEDF